MQEWTHHFEKVVFILVTKIIFISCKKEKRMKRKIVVCFLTLLISISIFATGCGKQEQITSSEYIAGKDDQTCLDGYRDVATSENGYYFLSNSFVYFYDSNSKKTHVLCNKPECAHDGEGCNAYINAMAIRYYEHALYYVSCDTIETNEFYLWKMSEDGTEKERLFFLCAEEQEGEMSQLFLNQFLVHRGFVYYELQNMDNGKCEIIKRQLKKGAKEKVIYTCKDDSSMVESLQASGNYLYFTVSHLFEEKYLQDICAYHIEKGKTDVLQKQISIAGGITAYDETVYYPSEGVLHCIGMDGKKKQVMKLPEEGKMTVYVNAKYISLDNINKLNLDEKTKQEDRYKKRCIYLYDKESGKLLTTFKTKNSDVFYLGYSHLILDGDSGEEFQLLSVEQLQEKNPDWKSLQLREE